MFEAAGWGALSSSTLIVGALVAYLLKPSVRLTAAVMAIGSGLLIGSVSYDLVADAQHSLPLPWIAVSLMLGAAVFVLGSRLIELRGGKRRKNPVTGGDDQPLGIVLGSALDGIPESFVLGLSVLTGGVSMPLLIGIGLSNLPEGMAASAGLRSRQWPGPSRPVKPAGRSAPRSRGCGAVRIGTAIQIACQDIQGTSDARH